MEMMVCGRSAVMVLKLDCEGSMGMVLKLYWGRSMIVVSKFYYEGSMVNHVMFDVIEMLHNDFL